MGLQDRDYMKRDGRERPFSPPPERSLMSWVGKLLFFIVLLYLGFKLAGWLDNKRAPKTPVQAPTQMQSNRPTESAPRASNFPPLPNYPTSPISPPETRTVTKCIVKGKTTYGDNTCAQGATTVQVITKNDHNLMTGMTPEQMAAARRIDAQANATTTVTITQSSTVTTNTSHSECKALDARVVYLDAMAREPQSMQTQDWIRAERKKARDRQFAIRC